MSSTNPLLSVTVPVPFDDVRAEHVVPAIELLLHEARARIDAIAANPEPPTYASTVEALERATARLDYASCIAGHLDSVIGSDDFREALDTVDPKISELATSTFLCEPLFRVLRDFAETDEARTLDPVRARFLAKTIADFRHNGAELADREKRRLAEIDASLTTLTRRFAQNVVDATAAYELMVDDPRALAGLPESAVLAARRAAEEKGRPGYRLTLQGPSYSLISSFADDRELRRAIHLAFVTRACGEDHDNRSIIREVVTLRRERARLLEFPTFADLGTRDRMAKSAARALGFISTLRDRVVPAFERENAELAAFAQERGHEGPLMPWDIPYFVEKHRRALYDFDREALRPWFSLAGVSNGLFEIAARLFGVRIAQEADAAVWHPEVTAWSVHDADGSRLGTIYFDLFPRETKRDGAWMDGVVDRLPGTNEEREGVAVIGANLTRPAAEGQPALLAHGEVETLFHEFGHAMHHILSEVQIRSLAGARGASDFVELPSTLMESWCWEREALDCFALHHQTGEPISDEVKERMSRARRYRAANGLMRDIGLSMVDLSLHMDFDPAQNGDVMVYARDVFAHFSPTPLPDAYAMIAHFTHLFGSTSGYAGGYYSYLWSETLAADVFSAFSDEGIFSASVGERFRRQVLARGSAEDPAVLCRAFLGRDPDVSALLKKLGVAM